MTKAVAKTNQKTPAKQVAATLEQVLIQGDLSRLDEPTRISYYKAVCESVGLNPLTKPFDYITLNNKLTLYALRGATDQLRKIHNVSITITSREQIGDVYVVTAQAKMGERCDESTGAVAVAGLRGDALANAYLKAETKAKRRVTLSLCGLGLLDETEVETIPGAQVQQPAKTVQAKEAPMSERLANEEQPPVEDDPGEYVYKWGNARTKNKKLSEIEPSDIESSVLYWETRAQKEGRELTGEPAKFVRIARDYLVQQNGSFVGEPPPIDEEEPWPPMHGQSSTSGNQFVRQL